jgi:hypothetical protein
MSSGLQKFLALLFIHVGVFIMFISSMSFAGESLAGLALFIGGFVWLPLIGRRRDRLARGRG